MIWTIMLRLLRQRGISEKAGKGIPSPLRRDTEFRGSLTVEAALLFPFVLLFFALFLSFLKCIIGWFLLQTGLMQVADSMAKYSVLYETFELNEVSRSISENEADLSDLELWLKQKAYEEGLNLLGASVAETLFQNIYGDMDWEAWGIANGNISFGGTKVFYEKENRNALIRVEARYTPFLFFSKSLFSLKDVTLKVVVHPFLGKDPFASDSRDDEKVYQIGNGDCYHLHSCYLIDKDVTEMSLLEAQKRGLSACKRCSAWESSKVYATKGGDCYHQKTCAYLFPNLTALTLTEAQEKGLSPCKICVGEGEWFDGNN